MEEKMMQPGDGLYPDLLSEISAPPEKLYYRGDPALAGKRCMAVVGSRKCTPHAIRAAELLGENLSRAGITVVSGLASGIDAAAHRGALKGGGNTIAVIANGLDICYPAQNKRLQKEIEERGLVISEYPDGREPIKGQFPVRNRIISGLSEAVIVVQAKLRSGSLITAEAAAEQGRDVYAVPGVFTDPSMSGTNHLLCDGAIPIFSVDQFMRDIGAVTYAAGKEIRDLSDKEKIVYDALSEYGEMTGEEIRMRTGLSQQEVSVMITTMELKGYVSCEMGKVFLSV